MHSTTKGCFSYRSFFLVISFISGSTCFAGHGGGGMMGGGGGYHQGGGGGYHQGNIGGEAYHNDGDYHQGIYNQGGGYYHHDDDYNDDYNAYVNPGVGHYYPGNGYIAPGVVLDPGDVSTNCQTVQQCNDNGTCILTENCD